MSAATRVKICGLTSPQDMDAVAQAGAHYAGLNFFAKSPRYVSPDQAREIALAAPVGVAKVALFVNADDAQIDAVMERVPLDFLQLHGQETPERLAELRARHGLPIIKAVGVAGKDDLAALDLYAAAADMLLVDAKPPKDAVLPGGNGLAFDWRLIANRRWTLPWMLAGGLTPANVAEAIGLTGAAQVDAASGVESAPGVKDAGLIANFVAATRR